MWRRTTFLLVFVRLYFALSSSYLHPDENFQGPEVIAGQIFNYPVKLTWEFTSGEPIRSVFPLWPVYGLPMLLLKWIWNGNRQDGLVTPRVVFWTLRFLMFTLSFVLEDWAIQELIASPKHRRIAGLLVASSYVTWTYQTHTFSNSIETLIVLWSLVMIQRIVDNKHSSLSASAFLSFLAFFGVFNRITFPAFLLIPGLGLVPHFFRQPSTLFVMILVGLLTNLLAISVDTEFYTSGHLTVLDLFTRPIITPLNNLRYNLNPSNLATHGTHPRYQHAVFNLPQLLGPAIIPLFCKPHLSLRLYSALSAIIVLSLFAHQEPRFLLPTIPLLLSSIRLPIRRIYLNFFIAAWIIFNAFFGILMGIYHQGGVIPATLFLGSQAHVEHAVWWKTYSPPIWLLGKNVALTTTHDLMGMSGDAMLAGLNVLTNCSSSRSVGNHGNIGNTYLIAPNSATFLDSYIAMRQTRNDSLSFHMVWMYRKHLNLDDLDFDDDGIWPTLQRVVGRRGIAIWQVTKDCT